MEELLTESSTIESNDEFTTTVNRFDPKLVKQGYYYLLALPYMKLDILFVHKDTPKEADRIQTEFIETSTTMVENTFKSNKMFNVYSMFIEAMLRMIKELASDFNTNRQLRKEQVEEIFKLTSSKYGKENWSKKTKNMFEFSCHLSLVSECFLTG